MIRPRLTATFALLGVIALTAGCSSGGGASASGSTSPAAATGALHDLLPTAVQSAGTLTVATDASYPPFEFFDTDNTTIVGADAEIAHALGDQLGITLKLQNTDFSGIVPGLAAGKFDMAISGLADTADRRKQVTFVDYAANGAAFLLPAANPHHVAKFADLCGLTAAVQTGTTMADDLTTASTTCTSAGRSAITTASFQTQDEGVLAVTSGRADLLVTTGGSGAYISTQATGQFTLVTPSDPVTKPAALGIAVPKGDTQLATAVQKALAATVADGTYATIMKKWGLDSCCTNTSGTIDNGQ